MNFLKRFIIRFIIRFNDANLFMREATNKIAGKVVLHELRNGTSLNYLFR